MELTLTMTFPCCRCGDAISATLACKGAGLADPIEGTVAAVNVPCPACGQVCQLLFDPHEGDVRDVRPHQSSYAIPEPSLN